MILRVEGKLSKPENTAPSGDGEEGGGEGFTEAARLICRSIDKIDSPESLVEEADPILFTPPEDVLSVLFTKNDYPNGRRCLAILDSHPGPSKVWLCFTDGRKDKMYERTVTISDALIGSLTEILGEGKVTVR